MAAPIRVRGLSRRGFRVDQDSRVNYATTASVDIDDELARRILFSHQGTYFSVPDFNFPLLQAGTVTAVTTASGLAVRAPRDLVITSVAATVGTAPAGSAIILDVHKVAAGGEATDAGTTIYTTQGNRPTIADAGTVSTTTAPDVTAWAAGDILRVEVDQVGSGTAGSDLYVLITADLG